MTPALRRVTRSDNPLRALPNQLLRSNFSWALAGNVIYASCQWGMLVVLAKLGSPEMVGQFALGLAVTAPVILLTSLQLRSIQATDTDGPYHFADYFGLRLLMTLLALATIAGIAFLDGYSRDLAFIIFVIALAKGMESISDVFYGLLQQHERMDRIAQSMIIKGFFSLLILSITVYLTNSVLWGSVSLALAWTLVLCVYDIPIAARTMRKLGSTGAAWAMLRPRLEVATLRQLAWLALPLGLSTMLNSLSITIPRYYVEHYQGERGLGIFAGMAYLLTVGTITVAALGQSAMPRLATYYAAQDRAEFQKLLTQLALAGLLIGVAGVGLAYAVGRPVLTLIYRPEYSENVDAFVWLFVGAGIGYVAAFLGYGITAARFDRVQLPLFAFVAGAAWLASIWLVPSQGLAGGAQAIAFGNLVQAVGSAAVVVYALYRIRGDRHTAGDLP
jgi:O-antigen/teichoic acid export membrane protein